MIKHSRFLRLLPDRIYLSLLYFYHFRHFPNLKTPSGFNEKTQWLKLYDRRPIYVKMVDKYLAKEYVASIIGEQYINPTIGVWNNADEIDFTKLPKSFVLKCNHDSGGLVICRDKSSLDQQKAIKRLNSALNNNGYWYGREWPYKKVKPLIIAEPYLEDTRTGELRDYKFFCFSGEPKILFVGSDRQTKGGVKFDFFDMDFNRLNISNGHPNSTLQDLELKPSLFEKMKELAKKLSIDLPFVRVDFYEVDGKVYFGELTLYHGSGCLPFEPKEWDSILGSWLELPPKRKKNG